jgi:hypothetical protein
LALPAGAQPDRLDGRRRQGRHQPEPRPEGLHRHLVHNGPDKKPTASRPAVREPYWFRYDWFNDEKNKADFKAKYGYDLGVPVNWSAYEDIAEFFTGRETTARRSMATWTMARRDPSLGWRFTDAWLSMAGNGDKGLPNGLPVDEWGIKVDASSRPVGSCTARGGDTNGPAAVTDPGDPTG